MNLSGTGRGGRVTRRATVQMTAGRLGAVVGSCWFYDFERISCT